MSDDRLSKKELGILLVSRRQLERQRLPELQWIASRVSAGNCVNSRELWLMRQGIDDALRFLRLARRNPLCRPYAARLGLGYHSLTEQALKRADNGCR